MMMTNDENIITTKEHALLDLERQYETPGEPLYMAGISKIKTYYQKLLSIDEIRQFLARSRTYTTHYQFKPPKFNPYYVRRLRAQFQLDLTEVSKISEHNDGINFLLLCIDIFSRKLWVRPLKRKTANEVLLNLQSILQETGNPESICSDRGTEFTNKHMMKFCRDQGILMKHPYTLGHAPHVERVGLTLQSLIYKHITSNMSYRFIDVLPQLVNTYNSRHHRSIGLSPNDGELPENHEHIKLMHEKYYSKIKPTKKHRFQVGDLVRIAKLESKFGRGYDKKAPEEIFRVNKVITKFPRVLYQITSLDSKETIIGSFYQEQLTKVVEPDSFIVEKVLKEDKKKGRLLVKWLGYMEPSWISKKDVTTIKDIQ